MVFSPSQSASPSIGRLPNNRLYLLLGTSSGLSIGDQTRLEQVQLAACQLLGNKGALASRGDGAPNVFPCFQNSFIQVNFVNLEKVEVLGLPGGEGELRVRGDKTVRSHNPLKLTGSRSFLYQLIWVVTEQHTTDFLLFPCRGLVKTVPGLLLLLCSTLFSPTCNRRQRIICLKNNNLTSFASHNGCE